MSLVILNAGHAPGGNPDPGAIGPSGVRESDVTRDIADRAAAYLETAGVRVIVVQDDDLDAICEIANENEAAALVSIHANACDNQEATGMEIFTSRGVTKADALATKIMEQMEVEFPKLPIRGDWSDGDVDKEAGLYVLLHTDMPAVLVETAFISNPKEEAILDSAEGKDMFAKAIARGCTDFFLS